MYSLPRAWPRLRRSRSGCPTARPPAKAWISGWRTRRSRRPNGCRRSSEETHCSISGSARQPPSLLGRQTPEQRPSRLPYPTPATTMRTYSTPSGPLHPHPHRRRVPTRISSPRSTRPSPSPTPLVCLSARHEQLRDRVPSPADRRWHLPPRQGLPIRRRRSRPPQDPAHHRHPHHRHRHHRHPHHRHRHHRHRQHRLVSSTRR